MNVDFAVIGGGFTGLASARDLARAGRSVALLEADCSLGGLAGAFQPGENLQSFPKSEPIDRFYHHWFTSDHEIMALIEELGLAHAVRYEPSLTGVYYNQSILRLSTPWDVLRFRALGLGDRFRLGLMVLRAKRIRDWAGLEDITAADWLRQIGGEDVYRTLWEPLLRGKFGAYAERVSAVWFWSKLNLRGSSRGKGGAEELAYVRGSFARVATAMAKDIRVHDGSILTSARVHRLTPLRSGDSWLIETADKTLEANRVIATPAPALVADMIDHWAPRAELERLRKIPYLANLCLVLMLDRPLSSSYWINVTDPEFPFVGVIEHTNFQSAQDYGGRHIVYLSRYLLPEDPLYTMSDDAVLAFALPHLQRMFPAFDPAWVQEYHVWRARWAQPVVECQYRSRIPPEDGPAPGLYLCNMAQIYPEDRGTNYAVRAGRRLSARLLAEG